ncbi:hypothetical protein CLAIMM_14552 [Cladophialophora immunda]|nr:hypothetical protein CLAIMM_14552 [Cladophialophora immunda]
MERSSAQIDILRAPNSMPKEADDILRHLVKATCIPDQKPETESQEVCSSSKGSQCFNTEFRLNRWKWLTEKSDPVQNGSPLPTEDFIRQAVDTSDHNALRLALLQFTGDKELEAMVVRKTAIRGGMSFSLSVSDQDWEVVREKAVAYLRRPSETVPPIPTREDCYNLLTLFSGEKMEPSQKQFSYEELALEDFPRQAQWTKPPPPEVLESYNVIIIGAGISGIAAALQLKGLNIPFTVVERQAGIGGTWLLNTYPEARVDTSSFLFQYKFEKNYQWTEHFASSQENQLYLNYIAKKYHIYDYFQFNREVLGATWNDADSTWTLRVTNKDSGSETSMQAKIIISACGVLSAPRLPKIAGIENYKGQIFHTASWNHACDFKAARCALIGTGSTGTQLAPGLARLAKSLSVYQRSANWIIPISNYRHPVAEHHKWLCDSMPYYWNWYCYSLWWQSLQVAPLQEHDLDWQAKGGFISQHNDALRATLTNWIKEKFASKPQYIEKLIPEHAPMVRRPPVDNGFYDCLLEGNVELITNRISRITETGILTEDGQHREYDVIVLGSGFKPFTMSSIDYVGRHGITLKESWKKDGARTYLGMAIPGYPNLFTLYGPNHQGRGSSMHSWAELWSLYTVNCIVHIIEKRASSMEVREDIYTKYNEDLDKGIERMIWESKGFGYYVNEFGRQCVNMPWTPAEYYKKIRVPNYADFVVK